MSSYTWNIIFIAVDTHFESEDGNENVISKEQNNEPVSSEIDKFKASINNKHFPNLSIAMLTYQNKGNNGIAREFFYNQQNNLEEVLPEQQNFDCDNYQSYAKFINKHFKKECKNLLIFLAHSFGAGFFPFKNADNSVSYFSTFELQNAINYGINGVKESKNSDLTLGAENDNKLDCFMALNCCMQSVETNFILKKVAKFIIGSQQILYPENISYKCLLKDLNSMPDSNGAAAIAKNTTEAIFTKFIYDSHRNISEINKTKLIQDNQHIEKPFSICLTKTKYIDDFFMYYGIYASYVYDNDKDQTTDANKNVTKIHLAKKRCLEPTLSQNTSIIDAQQFFNELLNWYDGNEGVGDLILKIKESISKLAVCYLTSGSATKEVIYSIDMQRGSPIYLSYGVGMFLPKNNKNTSTVGVILSIYDQLYNQSATTNQTDNETLKLNGKYYTLDDLLKMLQQLVTEQASVSHIIPIIKKLQLDKYQYFQGVGISTIQKINLFHPKFAPYNIPKIWKNNKPTKYTEASLKWLEK
jgi:hypothetical protein